MMINIYVGSMNPIKIKAVRRIAPKWIKNHYVKVFGVDVESIAPKQPMSRDDTLKGALSRAERAFRDDGKLSVGIESGLMECDFASSGYFVVTLCAIYDGETHICPGMSACYQVPNRVIDLLNHGVLNFSSAYYIAGLKRNRPSAEGITGNLTYGLVTRKDLIEQSVHMGFMHYFQRKLYDPIGNNFLRS